jgi:hypothetical protein
MRSRIVGLTVGRIIEIIALMAACLLGQAIAGYGQTTGSGRVLTVRTYNCRPHNQAERGCRTQDPIVVRRRSSPPSRAQG